MDPKVQLEQATAEVIAEDPLKGATEGIFLIRLDDAPLATYRGGISGLQATSPTATGDRKLDASAPESVAYVDYLEANQTTFVARMEKAIGHEADVRFTYTNSNNGLAVWLTPEEAAKVRRLSGVSFVQPDFEREIQTDTGPGWIGAPSIWGAADCSTPGSCGEGIVVGIIDTGINPSNPSFADIGGDGYDHTNPKGQFFGVCDPTNVTTGDIKGYDSTFPCNDKLIGAWGYASVDADEGADSPIDYDGHGSHTASTAAGNFVTATYQGPARAAEPIDISGVAPHANIIMYAGCCTGSALTASIDQAIADGVDVINYSIGSPSASAVWNDFDTIGFLNAREAGIFVATSAGNEGPGDATVGSPGDAPWLTTVAATTHSRTWANEVSFTGGDSALATINGNGYTDAYGPAPIVYAADFGDALCLEPFDPGTWTSDEIVVCDRGNIARTDKGVNVAAGGAGGLILANLEEDAASINGDPHAIPASHITYDDGLALKAWLAAGTGHTASITAGVYVQDPTRADIMAGFSSRGENRAIDIVSPSVAAPGVDILAAHGIDDPAGGYWDVISGTSMASPHVAGAGALLMQQHPTWTPAQIESALMLTGNTSVLDNDAVTPATPFAMGSGVVALGDANDAGLIMNETTVNYLAADPAAGGDPMTLNVPNMANSQCVIECSWDRTVTATSAGTWTVAASASGGVNLGVTPTSLTLAEGESGTVTVTADVTGAPRNVWAFGEVTLTAAGVPDSKMPVAVQPSTGSLPTAINIDAKRDSGSEIVTNLTAIEITELTIETYGLVKGDVTEMMLDQDPTNGQGEVYDNIGDGTVEFVLVDIPADAQRLVAETFETTSVDLDLYIGTGTEPSEASQVCFSASASALEYCSIDNPIQGTYWVLVQNWESSGATDSVLLSTAVVTGDEGNMLIEGPAQHPQLDPFDIRVFWDDEMDEGDLFYGAFTIGTDAAHPGNVGMVPVDVTRVTNDVTKSVDDAAVEEGDTVTFTIEVAPNTTQEELTYSLVDHLPDGLTYVPGSATGGLTLRSDGALTWTGNMLPPEPVQWLMSTNLTNAACDSGFGGYFDLAGLGFAPDSGISGDAVAFSAFSENVNTFFGENYTGVNFTDDGYVYFGDGEGAMRTTPQSIPDAATPNNVVAGLWTDLEIAYSLDTVDLGNSTGITLAGIGTSLGIIEYDDPVLAGTSTSVGDFQIWLWELDDTAGVPEIVFVYDNLDQTALAAAGDTTIGIENYDGTEAMPFLNEGDASAVLSDGLQICYDWNSPPRPAKVLTYQATVDEGTAGTIITNDVSHDVDQPGAREETSSVDVAVGDVTPPVDGESLIAKNVLANSLTLMWAGATDDRGVTGYGIYQDGVSIGDIEVSAPAAGASQVALPMTYEFDVEDLEGSTTYDFTVKAMDAQGNTSEGLMLEVATATDFTDDDFSIFEADIEWLFSAGITKGCNPPANDKYCPNASLGQLAAMISRALDLPATSTDYFVDDNGGVFENDINKLAEAGITFGCNVAGDRYCPRGLVTRGEIAAMLDRALDLTDTATDFFTDDDSNIFEASINRVAEAGITKGCNPPANDNYCPNDLLTRGQIAAFFRRALG